MPKIIENLETRLIEAAGVQLAQSGYGALTVRSVAAAVGVGVGTVYNYFPSKDALVAGYLLRDWNLCLTEIQEVANSSVSPEPVLQCIYSHLQDFSQRHRMIFQDRDAANAYAGSFGKYHGLLRSQIAQPLRKFCPGDFSSEFIAEALLTWTIGGKPFSDIYGMIRKLF